MKIMIKDDKLKTCYDMKLIIKSILSDDNYKESRKRLLELLRMGYIDYVELFKLRAKYYKLHKLR